MQTDNYRGKHYWDMIRISNDSTEYPSNMGNKWTEEEEAILLEEINSNQEIELISQKHQRTVGGINSRLRLIAYKLYQKNISIQDIMNQTKLDYATIIQTIEKRKNTNQNQTHKQTTNKTDNILITINKNDYVELKNDIFKIKNDINTIKNTLKKLIDMIEVV